MGKLFERIIKHEFSKYVLFPRIRSNLSKSLYVKIMGMSSFLINVKSPVSEVFSEIQQCVGQVNYKVNSIVPDQMLVAEGKREFNWGIVIALILLIWPFALVYYFTRQRSSMTATFTKDHENECSVTIVSNGKTGDKFIELVKHVFQDENKYPDPQLKKQEETQFWVCPHCGNDTQMKDGKQYCPPCKIYL